MKAAPSETPASSLPTPFPPRRIWILGAGHFGYIAAKRLSRRYADASFLVVDAREAKLETVKNELELPVHLQDALSFLGERSLPNDIWIIPAVPVHVAFQWFLLELNKTGRTKILPVPQAVDSQIPNPYRVESGTIYASFATFICPDACNEPDEICTYTKVPRPGNLFENFGQILVPDFQVVVVRSWQLAPGVGGYPGGYLKEKLEEIKEKAGAYLIGTSCRCHGVLDGLKWELVQGSSGR